MEQRKGIVQMYTASVQQIDRTLRDRKSGRGFGQGSIP